MVNEDRQPNEKYPEKDYTKTTFSFTSEERNKLASLDTMVQIGQVAQIMINQFIQTQCLNRVKIENTPKTRIIYNIPAGQFFVFSPREKVEKEVKK